MNVAGRILLALTLALTSLSAMSVKRADQSADVEEIRIGNLMPYTGPLAEFGAIGKAEAAYFDMINERGGINGRKVRFISYDDNSDPTVALDLTRGLVERENVLLMFGSYGTPGNLAVRGFLNESKIPQLFVASGAEELIDPKAFPWTMGWQPSFRAEGRIYANYIQAFYPNGKIVILWQDDQFGRDLYKGIQEGLGDLARMIIVGIAFDIADAHVDGHVSILKRSGGEILVFAGVPTTASKVIRLVGDSRWHPAFLLNHAAASIGTALSPAGVENAAGVISAAVLHGQVLPQGRQGQQLRRLRLRGSRNHGAGAQAMRRRSLPRKRDAAGSRAQGLCALRPVARDQDQHGSGEFPADQADAIGSVRWPHLAADRGRDRIRVFRCPREIVCHRERMEDHA